MTWPDGRRANVRVENTLFPDYYARFRASMPRPEGPGRATARRHQEWAEERPVV